MANHDNSCPPGYLASAQELASRYRCEFVDSRNVKLKSDILGRLPAHLMFRYSFLSPEEMRDGRLAIAVVDPGRLDVAR